MSTIHWIQTFFEICLVVFVLWGLFNEDILAKFEKRLFKKIKPCCKAIITWIIG